ncbi:MAG TPA: hypothetical protein VGY57_00285, partial [Vicinamibacterales bacterium]|nr:hypothetical protein [Vicinamibacterales bacterium]
MTSTDRLAVCGVLALFAALVYVNTLGSPFVYDDYPTMMGNASSAPAGDLHAIVTGDPARPMVSISYAFDRAVWGPGPFGFHLTSILLHVVNVVLFWQLAWSLTRNVRIAAAAASLFAVHPMMTEAVGHVSGRSEVLGATWLLAALWSAARWIERRGVGWAIGTVGFWTAAAETSETAAMSSVLIVACDWLRRTRHDQVDRS